MISNEKELYKVIDAILLENGYKKKADCWYKSTEECILFFCIKKSPFSGQYENVLGSFLKEIDSSLSEYPSPNKNHLKFTLENLTNKELVEKTLNLDNKDFKNDEREIAIKDWIDNFAIPFLNDVSTKSGIKASIAKYKGLENRIKINLKQYLELN